MVTVSAITPCKSSGGIKYGEDYYISIDLSEPQYDKLQLVMMGGQPCVVIAMNVEEAKVISEVLTTHNRKDYVLTFGESKIKITRSNRLQTTIRIIDNESRYEDIVMYLCTSKAEHLGTRILEAVLQMSLGELKRVGG
jgi:hypothetical protein